MCFIMGKQTILRICTSLFTASRDEGLAATLGLNGLMLFFFIWELLGCDDVETVIIKSWERVIMIWGFSWDGG